MLDYEGWVNAFECLINNHHERKVMMQNEQIKLLNDNSLEKLQSQVLTGLGLPEESVAEFQSNASMKD